MNKYWFRIVWHERGHWGKTDSWEMPPSWRQDPEWTGLRFKYTYKYAYGVEFGGCTGVFIGLIRTVKEYE